MRWLRVAKTLGVTTAGLALLAVLFVWSGVYNVAASRDHLYVMTWLLEQVREQSIATRSFAIDAPPLDDEGMIRLGASHYEAGCSPCHGRPGGAANPIVKEMLPAPPDLEEALQDRKPEEIYWIVLHGLKYTGMPAWPSQLRSDEVWAVAAFLQTLKHSKRQDYSALSGLTRVTDDEEEGEGTVSGTFTQCRRCHEAVSFGTNGDHIPRLSGQSYEYLLRSLREYARADRPSGVMEPVAARLDDKSMQSMARHFAEQSAPQTDNERAVDQARFERGRRMARQGLPEHEIPACDSCHSVGRSPQFPQLAGQHAEYLKVQLELWQRGGRTQTTYGRIMAPIARRLTEEQIADISYYYDAVSPSTAQPVAEVDQ